MKTPAPHHSFKASLTGWIAAQFLRVLGWTLRLRVEDACGITRNPPASPVIWVFWHNRMLGVLRTYLRHYTGRSRRRMAVMTSASRDGAVLAKVMGCFGVGSVRGSSSKRGALALAELRSLMAEGTDGVLTPDGPRGPCYRMAAGPVKLAQLTGASVQPIKVRYQNAWRLKSWDRFFIPKPFSRVVVTFLPPITVDPSADGDAFEAERRKIEAALMPDMDDQ